MDVILYVAFPYLAIILAVGVGIYRKLTNPFSYSSLSSQLLENKQLFWGSVPWHYGITLILLGHLIPWLVPGAARYVLADPIRLVILELLGLALSLFTVFGLAVLIIRRLPGASRAEAVTSWMDWVLLFFFALQVVSGIGVALFDRWGSLWFLSSVAPWLWSLVLLHPKTATVVALPAFIQFHILLGFVLIMLFPFSRLVHIFTIPLKYLRRPYQVVVWYRDPRQRSNQAAAQISAIKDR
jgi:nitrate reductase gamma subunit